MSKLYLIFGFGGAGLAATGTGLGIYYGIQSKDDKKPEAGVSVASPQTATQSPATVPPATAGSDK